MVCWYEHLFLDGITGLMVEHIREKIAHEKIQYPVFCVAFAANDRNLLDVMNVNELLFLYYRKRTTKILGLASSRQQAKLMAAAIVSKVYEETGDFLLEEYFRDGFAK